jgi:hypothetical protein
MSHRAPLHEVQPPPPPPPDEHEERQEALIELEEEWDEENLPPATHLPPTAHKRSSGEYPDDLDPRCEQEMITVKPGGLKLPSRLQPYQSPTWGSFGSSASA